jgi:hypothetical protein
MMAGEFWLTAAQWGAIEPLLSKNQSGARRADDRRVISGIVHVLKDPRSQTHKEDSVFRRGVIQALGGERR